MPEIIPNLHPLFVHFPIAFISVSALFHLAATIFQGRTYSVYYAILAHTTLWLGALAILPTAFFGLQAFNSVNHDEVSHAAMLIHRNWALGSLVVLAILSGCDIWRNKVNSSPSWWFTLAVIGVSSMIAITAWHGGELVYRHRLGVMSLPIAAAGHEYDHYHGAITDSDEHAHTGVMLEDQVHEHTQHERTH